MLLTESRQLLYTTRGKAKKMAPRVSDHPGTWPTATKGGTVDEVRILRAGDPIYAAGKRNGSTRHHRVDDTFLELLEEDFGISQFALRSAFMGVPPASKRQAVELCEWATRRGGGDSEKTGAALRAWAKKHQAGTYDPRLVDAPPLTYEASEHERRVRGEA
jgi:hypothetical protein